VWESEGYALSGHQVMIKYDGGVGNFVIKQQDIQTV
jgi:hypothetical protein